MIDSCWRAEVCRHAKTFGFSSETFSLTTGKQRVEKASPSDLLGVFFIGEINISSHIVPLVKSEPSNTAIRKLLGGNVAPPPLLVPPHEAQVCNKATGGRWMGSWVLGCHHYEVITGGQWKQCTLSIWDCWPGRLAFKYKMKEMEAGSQKR